MSQAVDKVTGASSKRWSDRRRRSVEQAAATKAPLAELNPLTAPQQTESLYSEAITSPDHLQSPLREVLAPAKTPMTVTPWRIRTQDPDSVKLDVTPPSPEEENQPEEEPDFQVGGLNATPTESMVKAVAYTVNEQWLNAAARPKPNQHPIITSLLNKLSQKGIKGLQDEYKLIRTYTPIDARIVAFTQHPSKNRYKGELLVFKNKMTIIFVQILRALAPTTNFNKKALFHETFFTSVNQ